MIKIKNKNVNTLSTKKKIISSNTNTNTNIIPTIDLFTGSIKIPKNIFRTFKYEFNEEIKQSWITMNPDYRYYFYNNDDCLKLIKEKFNQEVYDAYMTLNSGAAKADLWRCCILYLYGGIYIDIDCICLKKMDDILRDNDFVIPIDTYGRQDSFYNAFIASTPRNNILLQQINRIVYNTKIKFFKNNIFLISGPISFGFTIAELLNYNHGYIFKSSIIESSIDMYKNFSIDMSDKDEYNIINVKNILIYNPTIEYYTKTQNKNNYSINKKNNNAINNKEIGCNNDLNIAVCNSSNFTYIEKFYFGEYTYNIGNSDENSKIIRLKHQEYKKLISNIQFISIDYDIKYKFEHTIISFDEENLLIEIKRIDSEDGWKENLNISIHYKSLLINTEINSLEESKITVYDFIDYYKSNNIKVEPTLSELKYSIDNINNSNFLISLYTYNFYIPIYTIISINIPNTNYPQKQKINLLMHIDRPEYITFSNIPIIQTQIDQKNKESISVHYNLISPYTDYISNNKKNFEYICSFEEN